MGMQGQRFLVLMIMLVLSISAHGQICHPQLVLAPAEGECNTNPYVLVFEDNFDVDTLNTALWQIQLWGQGSLSGDNTQQYYSLDNVSLLSGICTITARRDTVLRRAVNWLPDSALLADSLPNLRTYYFTSSNLWTHNKFKYGKYEIRCRIPSGKGFWPAFWMYGQDSSSSSEIDVFEFWDNNTVTHHMTAHYSGMMCTDGQDGPDYSQSFHIYTVTWDPYKIDWYTDDTLRRRITRYNTLLAQHADCDAVHQNNPYILEKTFPEDSMYIITNLAIQKGDFSPDSTTLFPAVLQIDYIRYYEQLPVSGMQGNALNGNPENMQINVYPNPGTQTLTLEYGSTGDVYYAISLMDDKGKQVYSMPDCRNHSINININNLSSGIYILTIHDYNSRFDFHRKVVLSH